MSSLSSTESVKQGPPNFTPKRAVQLVVSLAVSAAFVWWILRGVDLARVGQILGSVSPGWIVGSSAALVAFHLLRIWRFRYLTLAVAPMSFGQLFRIGNIGTMAVLLLPVRLGEFVRPYLMRRELGCGMAAGLGTVAVERVIDGLVVMLGFFLITHTGVAVDERVTHAGLGALLVFAGAAVALSVVMVGHGKGARLIHRPLALVSVKLADMVVAMLTGFAKGLGGLASSRYLGVYVGWTLLFWGAAGASNWLLLGAMDISLPFIAGYVLLGLQVIGVMLPSGPGMIGPLQAAIVWGLTLYGVDRETAVAFSLLSHMLSVSCTMAFGMYSLLTSQLSLRSLVSASQSEAAG